MLRRQFNSIKLNIYVYVYRMTIMRKYLLVRIWHLRRQHLRGISFFSLFRIISETIDMLFVLVEFWHQRAQKL